VTVEKTDEPVEPPTAELPTTPPPPPDPAIARYHARMRPWRIVYTALVSVVVVTAVIVAWVAWEHGEIAHTTLNTAAKPLPAVRLVTPSTTQSQAWSTTDRTAIGTPYWRGAVITAGHDSVSGRNALTGKVIWSYTRTDRTLCQAIQDQGVTLALFAVAGNCDELTALGSSTGKRRWTRTLDENGSALDGFPTYSIDQSVVMFVSAHAIYAISPTSGEDWWVFNEQGCTVHSAVIGSTGALISQTCSNRSCKGVKYCGDGPQLLLRDQTQGQQTDNSKNNGNPDQIKWNLIGNRDIPASSAGFVSALAPAAPTLLAFDPATGKTRNKMQLATGATATGLTATPTSTSGELIWAGGTTYAFDDASSTLSWSQATVAPPTVTAAPVKPGADTIAAASATGVETLDPVSGSPLQTFTVTAPAAGSLVYPFGSGFLVAGTGTTLYS
jgi:hypothetical protein